MDRDRLLIISSIALAFVVAIFLFVAFRSDTDRMLAKARESAEKQKQSDNWKASIQNDLAKELNTVANWSDLTQKFTSNLDRKHRMLMVEIDRNSSEYAVTLPEDAFLAGVLTECCGYDSFVKNADEWKNEFDVVVVNMLNDIPYQSKCTPTQIRTAIKKFMDAGVFLVWCKPSNDLSICKYGANGSIDSAQDANMSGLLSGLSRSSMDYSAGTGTFRHGTDYPFGTAELIRTVDGVACKPTNQWLNNFTSTDPDTVFPIVAVQGETTANCTAYKPGKFFIISDGGYGGDNIDQKAFYKYIDSSVLLVAILGKTSNVRFSQDSIYGRRIAAIGVDCDVTTEPDAIKALVDAFSGKPIELGLVAKKVTDRTADLYQQLAYNNGVALCSHTYDHFTSRDAVTDEVHTVGSDQLVTLSKPFKALVSSVSTTDNAMEFTQNGSEIDTATPAVTEFAMNMENDYITYSIDGVLKFNSSMIGTTVKITYTCDNEYTENLGSIEILKAKGCLTSKALYQTAGFYSAQPSTYKLADESGTTICTHSIYPGYNMAYQIEKGDDKAPIPMGIIAKPWYNGYLCDAIFLSNTKAYCKETFIPAVMSRCAAMELPLEFYIHDFPLSQYHEKSCWISSAWAPDWKQSTLQLTRAYLQDFYKWMAAQFDSINAFWMTRSEYVARFYYMNKYLVYDVAEETGRITITIENAGNKLLKGATFRIPVSIKPTSVKTGVSTDCNYIYASNLVTAWCDLEPGKTKTLVVEF